METTGSARRGALGARKKAAALTLLFTATNAWALPPLAIVRHLTRVKIIDSNNVSIRPGSIYDNITYFESLGELPRPGFNYEFIDTGLGAADPLYPNYQKGHQGSWLQLIPAFFSDQNRHIDHFTSLPAQEGCFVDSAYLLRSIKEFPKTMYQKEREEGYDLIVIRLEYYTRLRPDAECGRHRTNAPDPKFKPMKFLRAHLKARSLDDFPPTELARFEAKTSAIRHITQEFSKTKWPRFDLGNLNRNSLWYYPDGFKPDYGIDTPRPQYLLDWLQLPRHLVASPTDAVRADLGLERMLSADDFGKLLAFISGKPTPDFDPASEPGHDTLNLADVTPRFIYTSGLEIEPIRDARADVSDPSHFKLVGVTFKPYEMTDDLAFTGERTVPQIRLVYQLMNPRTGKPTEQFFLHLKYDSVDRLAPAVVREAQHAYFLWRLDRLTKAKETLDPAYDRLLAELVHEFATARPIEAVSFSSSLTGIWVFGALSRSYNEARTLQPMRIVRDGVDVGYYSSSYDNDLFRAAIAASSGETKVKLQQHMDDITVSYYRDPKRMDPHAIRFNRVTCAQCHQTSGRDGVHMAFNDGLDSRFKDPIRGSEYLYHEADRQLLLGQDR